MCYTLFFTSNTFISNARLKLTKKYPKGKQHPEDELMLCENYSYFSSRHHPKMIGLTQTNKQQKQACLHS